MRGKMEYLKAEHMGFICFQMYDDDVDCLKYRIFDY